MKMSSYNLYAVHPGTDEFTHVGHFETLAEVETKVKALYDAYIVLGFKKHNVRVKIENYIYLTDED